MTNYERKHFSKGRTLEIRTTTVSYNLDRIDGTQDFEETVFEEGEEVVYRRTRNIVVRPDMTVEATYVSCRNRFGLIRAYGPQNVVKR